MTRIYGLVICLLLCISAGAKVHPDAEIDYIENKGQWEQEVLYKADLRGGWVFLSPASLTFLFQENNKILHPHSHGEGAGAHEEPSVIRGHVYRTHWLGAKSTATVTTENSPSYYFNYFLGNDPARWQSNVLAHRVIKYNNLYNNIDLKIYSEGHAMKSDYIVRKKGKVGDIRIQYEGVDAISLEADGSLKITTSINTVQEFKPYAYQVIDGREVEVPCVYSLRKNVLSFDLPKGYNKEYDLVIDPTLVFSTYSGSTADNWGSSATNDHDGNMFLGGITLASGYPTTVGAFQTAFGGGSGFQPTDVVITKFTATGTARLYSTHLGGNGNEVLSSLYCTPQNELIVLLTTGSSNFPTSATGYDRSYNGGTSTAILEGSIDYINGSDIAILKLNSAGSALVGSTFFGGSGNEGLNQSSSLLFNYGDESRGDIAVDDAGNIYITSNTTSNNIPGTSGKAQPNNAGLYDGIVLKFNSNLSALSWATYYGGSGNDATYSIELDNSNNILLCGGTSSSNLPSMTGVNTTYRGGSADGFVAKLNNAGTTFMGGSYLGTGSYDQGYIMEVDNDGDVYIFGQTLGSYPVTSGVYSNANSRQFIHKLNSTLTTTQYSTVFGRPNYQLVNISPTALLVDVCENLYAVGWGGNVNSDFQFSAGTTDGMPVTNDAFKPTTDGSDFYLISLSRNADSLVYGTYFGENFGVGDHVDGGTSRFDKNGVVYQAVCASCGGTNSFPTTQGAYSRNNLSSNCNMAGVKFRFDLLALQIVTTSANPSTGCAPLTTSFAYTSTRPGTSYEWNFGDGSPVSTAEFPTHTFQNAGTYTVKFILRNPADCNPIDSSTVTVVVRDTQIVNLTRTICQGESVTIGNQSFNQTGNYTVVLNTPQGCDSTVNLALTVNPNKSTNISRTICQGQSVTIGTQTFNQTGNYSVTLETSLGCDSVVNLALTVNPSITTDVTETICEGESVTIGGQTFTATGNYSVTLTTTGGCDSIVELDLTVIPTVTTDLNQQICTGQSFTVGGQTFNTTGNYTIDLTSSSGCDSIVELALTVTDSIVENIERTICTGGRVVIGNDVFTLPGNYTVFLTAVAGCDSTVNLTLSVVDSFVTDIDTLICEGESITVGTDVFDETGIYSVTLASSQGCDSIINLDLVVAQPSTTILEDNICAGESITIGNETFDETGQYTVVLTNSLGCDSTINLSLFVGSLPQFDALVDDTLVAPGTEVQLSVDPADPSSDYSWSPQGAVSNPNIDDPTAVVEEDTWFYVTVTDEAGCSNIDSVLVRVVADCGENTIYLPTAFTPNGDGQNDVYLVRTATPLEAMNLVIYNRWGEKVFETIDQTQGWDGTFNDKLAPADAYGFYFEALCSGNTIKKQGNITILR